MNPTKAAVPMPAVRFSIATTVANAPTLCGYQASTTKPSVEIIWPKPNNHNAR